MKFNPGDRVQRLPGFDHEGKVGIVVETRDGDDPGFVYILFDEDGSRYGSYPNRLTLLQLPDGFEVDE